MQCFKCFCSRLLEKSSVAEKTLSSSQVPLKSLGFLLAGNAPGVCLSVKPSFVTVEDKFLPEKLELWLNFTKE